MPILADHTDAWGVAEQLVVTLGAVIIATLPMWASLHRKANRTYRQLNNIEENESVPDGGDGPTLGRLVQEGFKRNDRELENIRETLHLHTELLKEHGRFMRENRRLLEQMDAPLRIVED